MKITKAEVVQVFTEWDKRHREDPRGYESDFERLLRGQTVEEYGDAVTPYFLELLEDVREEIEDVRKED